MLSKLFLIVAALLVCRLYAVSPPICDLVECEPLPELSTDGEPCQPIDGLGCCQMCARGRYERCGHFDGQCKKGMTCDRLPGYPSPEEYGFTGMCKRFRPKSKK